MTRGCDDEREEAAWGGRARGERRSSTPKGSSKKVEVTGNVPDYNKTGMGIGYGVLGVVLLALAYLVALPELDHISHADTCFNDCIIGKMATGIFALITMVGGIFSVVAGIGMIVESLGIVNENTICVKVRELSS